MNAPNFIHAFPDKFAYRSKGASNLRTAVDNKTDGQTGTDKEQKKKRIVMKSHLLTSLWAATFCRSSSSLSTFSLEISSCGRGVSRQLSAKLPYTLSTGN